MAASSRISKTRLSKDGEAKTVAKPTVAASKAAKDSARLDRLIHERTRLAMVSALAANSTLTFNDLKSLLQVSDGNLSAHARKLEDAGYVDCSKGFDGRVPRTEYMLTDSGSEALQRDIGHMEALIRAMKKI